MDFVGATCTFVYLQSTKYIAVKQSALAACFWDGVSAVNMSMRSLSHLPLALKCASFSARTAGSGGDGESDRGGGGACVCLGLSHPPAGFRVQPRERGRGGDDAAM